MPPLLTFPEQTVNVRTFIPFYGDGDKLGKVILINYKELADMVFPYRHFNIRINFRPQDKASALECLWTYLQMCYLWVSFETIISFWSIRKIAHVPCLFPYLNHSVDLGLLQGRVWYKVGAQLLNVCIFNFYFF